MPSFDLISLAILWSIALLALIQTLNATGAIKAAISGIVTVIIFLMAIFFSFLKVEGYGTFLSRELSPSAIIAANIAANEAMAKERAADSAKVSFDAKPATIELSSSAKKGETVVISEESLDIPMLEKEIKEIGYELVSHTSEPYEKKGLFRR